jgi:hypothetical protein
MSTAPTRRHDDFNYRLPDRSEIDVDSLMETRITGVRHCWPVDADTTERLKNLGQEDRTPIWHPYGWLLIAVAIVIGIAGYVLVRMVGE